MVWDFMTLKLTGRPQPEPEMPAPKKKAAERSSSYEYYSSSDGSGEERDEEKKDDEKEKKPEGKEAANCNENAIDVDYDGPDDGPDERSPRQSPRGPGVVEIDNDDGKEGKKEKEDEEGDGSDEECFDDLPDLPEVDQDLDPVVLAYHQETTSRCRSRQGQKDIRVRRRCGKWVVNHKTSLQQHEYTCAAARRSSKNLKGGKSDGKQMMRNKETPTATSSHAKLTPRFRLPLQRRRCDVETEGNGKGHRGHVVKDQEDNAPGAERAAAEEGLEVCAPRPAWASVWVPTPSGPPPVPPTQEVPRVRMTPIA